MPVVEIGANAFVAVDVITPGDTKTPKVLEAQPAMTP
jgi:hypothetical protein